ncbi:class C beta-lactamase-related serine hydrolase [Robertkochia marina]|uniref:Class C beta-lactamase-related serine hydrolase n=1 Tax=Robertkochia marina TaxID=1227945 RepID=A0A4S3M3Z4_9FLAO|nr:serine hydrolase [Robertkochia marina]THD69409.1 class C beta-lactamase-related serine hydrolase [Robertkochia marina]TRZ47330.1 class C beta-lactamase-related serine hydrolase [Robertkochia marina]
MKLLKNLFKFITALLLLLVISLYAFNYDYLLTAARVIYMEGHKTAYLDDYKHFDNRVVEAPDTPQPWPEHKHYNLGEPNDRLMETHSEFGTVAFLIFQNDSLRYENYFDGYNENSKSNSFSMAKSFVSAMLGHALMEGSIKSLDQPVGDFFPEFKEGLAGEMTVGDLSSMSSGLNWDESYYSPFSVTTRAYFDESLAPIIKDLKVVEQPGKKFKYLSGNTQLLAMVLQKATGSTLSEYISEHFWKPMGAEHDALWQLDSEDSGMEKAYCCVAASARDFARFGKLYKDGGLWNDKRILPEDFAKRSIVPRFPEDTEYGYGLWLLNHMGKDFFMLRGHLGQYVIVQPEDNIMIVRLGHQAAPKKENDPFRADTYIYIEEAYKILNNAS